MTLYRYFVPSLMGQDWWDWDYPTSIFDQDLDTGLFDTDLDTGLFDTDLLPPMLYRGYAPRPRTQAVMQSSGRSEVKNDKHKFKVVMFNVSQFQPEEIDIKLVDNFLVIHGKHEEKCDEHGFIQREYTRRYAVPEGTEAEAIKSSLNAEGILTITIPKKAIETPPNERTIPITIAGKAENK